jgi:hypothetical protein
LTVPFPAEDDPDWQALVRVIEEKRQEELGTFRERVVDRS